MYGSLEFGDSRETVTRKLKSSSLVEATVADTFLGRTGLNGIFKCKAKLAGLTYHLYFGWDEKGGLNEITLRSNGLPEADYGKGLRRAWVEAETLLSQVYKAPIQKSGYPNKSAFKEHPILVSHVWHRGGNNSILMGPGMEKQNCYLAIRFVKKRIQLPRR